MDMKNVQFLLSLNKSQIGYIEANIEHYRARKTYADENGFL
jgi:hypothetical protein